MGALPPGVTELDDTEAQLPLGVVELPATSGLWDQLKALPGAVGREALTAAKTTGSEFGTGLQRMFRPPQADSIGGSLAEGGDRILGLLQAIGAPVTGFVYDPLKRGVAGVSEQAGASPEVAQMLGETAGLAGSALAPSSLTNAIPRAIQGAAQLPFKPAQTILNRLDAAKQYLSAPRRVNPSMTFREAYQPIDFPATPMSSLPLAKTQEGIDDIINGMSRRTQGGGRRFDLGDVEKLRDAGKITNPADLAYIQQQAQGAVRPTNAFEATVLKIQSDIASASGKLNPAEIQIQMHKLGPHLENYGLARNLYKQFILDLKSSKLPEAQALLEANRVARQKFAAEELADVITMHGTHTDNQGFLRLSSGSAHDAIRRGKVDMEAFDSETRNEILSTLDQVFRASRGREIGVQLSRTGEVVSSIRPEPSVIAKHPWITAAATAPLLGPMLGIGRMATVEAAYLLGTFYPRLIARTAQSPQGRTFLKTLYADMPPKVGDVAKFQALVQFMQSRGESFQPGPGE